MRREVAEGFLTQLNAHRPGTTGIEGATEHADEAFPGNRRPRSKSSELDKEKETEAKLRELKAIARAHGFVLEGAVLDAQARREQMLGIHQRVKVLENAPESITESVREAEDLIVTVRTMIGQLSDQIELIEASTERKLKRERFWKTVKIGVGVVSLAGVAGVLALVVLVLVLR